MPGEGPRPPLPLGRGAGRGPRALARGEPVLARRASARERAVKWACRKPAIAALSGALLVAVVLGGAIITWKWREAVKNENEAIKANTTLVKTNADLDKTNAELKKQKQDAERQSTLLAIDLAMTQCALGQTDRGLLRLARGLGTGLPL